jgi:hypothetical protein
MPPPRETGSAAPDGRSNQLQTYCQPFPPGPEQSCNKDVDG